MTDRFEPTAEAAFKLRNHAPAGMGLHLAKKALRGRAIRQALSEPFVVIHPTIYAVLMAMVDDIYPDDPGDGE